MRRVYNGYNINLPAYGSGYLARNNDFHQPVLEALTAGIQAEASAVDFYSRLASCAPNQRHKQTILHALEDKKVHLKKFTDQYIAYTGKTPEYHFDRVAFHTYREGLEKAYAAETGHCKQNRHHYMLTSNLPVGNLFFQAFEDEIGHAARFDFLRGEGRIELKDYGSEPFTVDIEDATLQNDTFRTALWTGNNLQVTVMSLDVGEDIGLEVHPQGDQFIRVEEGQGFVQMGDSPDRLDFEAEVTDDFAIMIPAGKWHNVTNTGDSKLKVYVIYAPPEHPYGTVHTTKAEAMAAESMGQ